jgi:hypothetical protein
MIVGGIILFMHKNGELSRDHQNEDLGKFFVFLSLCSDGVSAAIQVE